MKNTMNNSPEMPPTKTKAFRDLVIILIVAVSVCGLAVVFDLLEMFVEWSREYEAWQIDEIIIMLVVSAFALAIFSLRRWRELIQQIAERKRAEQALQQARAELERLVEERTAELSLAVANLKEEVAERQRVEEALRESEEQYRDLYENAPLAYFSVGADQVIKKANRRAVELLNHAMGDLIGRDILEFYAATPNGKEKARQVFERLLAGEHIRDEELEMSKADGHLVWVSLTVRPIRDAGGEIVESRSMIVDITERKQAEEALHRSEEQLRQIQKLESIGQLAGGVAHDFNNLLTAIMGQSGMALRALPPNDPVRSNIQEIRKAADHAANLTRQLLAFARKQVIEVKTLNLNDLVLNVDKLLRRLIGEDIELVTLPASDLGQVKADPGQLEQVLVNLAVNARDAMPKGGKLTIETANVTLSQAYARQHAEVTPGEYVMLAVSDTGIGMTEEVKAHIFEPFFTTKEMGKGTGLGLATCFGIVKQIGGHIWVYSEPDQGTTFKIYLPRVEAAADLSAKPEEVDDLPRGTETVLLVEDEPAVRVVAVQTLQEQGYTVLEAANGDEALRVAQERAEEAIHLLLTDVVMPRMSGKELASQLKTIRPGLKVLFISGYTDNAIIHNGVLEPGIAFLQKPFTPEVLARKVREVLDR
jgi:PAS domain S-box-containing protein